MTPIQSEVTELSPIQNGVRKLSPIQNEVRELTALYTGGAEGPERPPIAAKLLGKCLGDEGKFKSPKEDTVPITSSHIFDTASNSHKSLTTDTDLNTNNNQINGLITFKPKTLPLAHTSNQSLILDTDLSKSHHINSIQFTHSSDNILFYVNIL